MTDTSPNAYALYIKQANGRYAPANNDTVVDHALHIVDRLYDHTDKPMIADPSTAKRQLYLRMHREHEVFVAMFLNSKHRILAVNELFRGTIDNTSIPVREVVKEALRINAAAMLVSHNHPSGDREPSMADQRITNTLSDALNLVGVRLLDHLVFGDGGYQNAYSFAENGLLP